PPKSTEESWFSLDLEWRDRLQNRILFFTRFMPQRFESDRLQIDMRVRYPVQHVANQREPSQPLIVEIHDRPRRMGGMRGLQHLLARAGVIFILRARDHIDGRELPALERVFQPFEQA